MEYYDNQVTPYDDIYMTYNTDTHRYTLTVQSVDDAHFITKPFMTAAGSEEVAESRLDETSKDMYKYIYRMTRRGEKKRKVVEHMLAKNGDLRDVLRDSMLDMVRALIRSGYGLQKDLGWVNTATGTVFDFKDIPAIAPSAVDGLLAAGILFKGVYTYRIEEEDYRSDY